MLEFPNNPSAVFTESTIRKLLCKAKDGVGNEQHSITIDSVDCNNSSDTYL